MSIGKDKTRGGVPGPPPPLQQQPSVGQSQCSFNSLYYAESKRTTMACQSVSASEAFCVTGQLLGGTIERRGGRGTPLPLKYEYIIIDTH